MTSSGAFAEVATQLVTGRATSATADTPPAGLAASLRCDQLAVDSVAGLRAVDTATTTATPLTLDTQHDLASVTKIMATTACLLALVSARAVGLDDAVHRYLPRFIDGDKVDVTVRDLLWHRAGLWEWYPVYLSASDPAAADEFVDRLPLRYAPCIARHYSDLGFMLLGRIAAAAAALPLPQAVAELVTEPLGLVHTAFAHPSGDDVAMSSFDDGIERAMIDSGSPYPVPHRSDEFSSWRTAAVIGDVNDGNAFHAYGGVAGHAGLFSDVHDLVRFGAALARPEAHDDLWRADVVAEFFAPGPDDGQSLGFRRYPIAIVGEPVSLVGHTGFVGCAVGFVPGTGVALAMVSNRLVTSGTPLPTDELWRNVVDAAARALGPEAS